MTTITVDLERQTEPCGACDSDSETLVAVVTRLGRPADHYCLSCACTLKDKLDRLLREVPTI